MLNTLFFVIASFYFMIFFSLIIACLAISSTNVFLSIVFLILTYFSSAWLLGVLHLEFLAFIILIVYIGAISILFLFVSMFLPESYYCLPRLRFFRNFFGLTFLCVCICFIFIVYFLLLEFESGCFVAFDSLVNTEFSNYTFGFATQNMEEVGFYLYTTHAIILVLCGVLLLITSLIVVNLAKRG